MTGRFLPLEFHLGVKFAVIPQSGQAVRSGERAELRVGRLQSRLLSLKLLLVTFVLRNIAQENRRAIPNCAPTPASSSAKETLRRHE